MNISLLFAIAIMAVATVSCNDIKRTPGSVYMPDMAYSRAYETYADHSNLAEKGINYNNLPVAGTLARGKEMPFPYAKDKVGDTTNYVASKSVMNPIDSLSAKDLAETERLYLINCGICHGPKLNGNGPLYKDGNGPYAAKPATLVGDAKYENMPAGQMFYSVAYGKNLMGSYASQLSRHQRWMIIKYIKNKQAAAKAAK
ncbi:MAG: cytochrome c [Chitinophagaceae bacterium]|nr:MAG: cytochrome c [Chitinophagaceae bacterium]